MKVLSISPRDIDFYNFRRDTALHLSREHEIVVACEKTVDDVDARFRYCYVSFQRGSLRPWVIASEILKLRKILRTEKPTAYICYTFKVSLIAAMASLFLAVRRIHVLTGMGYSFTSTAGKAKILRTVAIVLSRLFFKRNDLIVLNQGDLALVRRLKFSDHTWIVEGEGLEPARFSPVAEAPGFRIGYIGRFLRDKGVMKFIELGRLLRERGVPVEFDLYGTFDRQNPESLSEEEYAELQKCPWLHCHGFARDVNGVWAKSHLGILLSKREGAPMALLEAMACRRPIVASNIDACREMIEDGLSGYLVDEDNLPQIAERIEDLYRQPGRRQQFAERAYANLLNKFSAGQIARKYLEILKSV